MAYGVTNEGFVIKKLDTLIDDFKTKIRTKYPEALLSDETIEGQFMNITADVWSTIWEILQDSYHASHIEFAENASLDFLMALNKIKRRSAQKSVAKNVVITGTPSVVIAAGFRAEASTNPANVWETLSQVTVGTGGTVTTDLVCTVTGPNDVSPDTIDTILTPVTGITAINNPDITIIGSDEETDPEMLVRRDDEIANSLGGSHAGIYNAVNKLNEDETLRIIDFIRVKSNRTDTTDSAFRPPHSFEIIVSDAATYTSISTSNGTIANSDIELTVTSQDLTLDFSTGDTIAVSSDYNSFAKEKFTIVSIAFTGADTLITLNSNYKGSTTSSASTWSVESKDTEIASAIWDAQAGGIGSYGISNITIQDIEGNDEVVSFSHPAPITIHLKLTLTVSEALTTDEKTDLKAKIATWGNSLGVGQDVVVYGYNCLVGQLNNSKITDVAVAIGTTSSPSPTLDDNIPISDGTTAEVQYSSWSVSNITLL